MKLLAIELLALGLAPFKRPLRVGHNQADNVWLSVAGDHCLTDFGLQRQHALDLLRRDIVTLVVDDHVFLAVGNDNPAFVVEVSDIAGVQPAILDRPRSFAFVLPVSMHDEFAAAKDFSILCDLDLYSAQSRADGMHGNAGGGPVAAYDRPCFGLPIALKHGQPHRFEEYPDVGVERRATGHHRFHATPETLADFGFQQTGDREILQLVAEFRITRSAAFADLAVARADLVEAGVLVNPDLQLLFGVGSKPFELLLGVPLQALWQRPRRVTAAKLNLEKTSETLVQSGLDLARDVRVAHAAYSASLDHAKLHGALAKLTWEISELTKHRLRAGDISELDARLVEIEALRAGDRMQQASQEINIAWERLRPPIGLPKTDSRPA